MHPTLYVQIAKPLDEFTMAEFFFLEETINETLGYLDPEIGVYEGVYPHDNNVVFYFSNFILEKLVPAVKTIFGEDRVSMFTREYVNGEHVTVHGNW